MTIIGLSDFHGDLSALPRLADELQAADLVLLLGDLTNFGRGPEAAQVLDAVSSYNRNILAVPGNCDRRGVGQTLLARGISLDTRGVVRNGLAFVGVGSSLPTPGRNTPSEVPEEVLAASLDAAADAVPGGLPLVVVSHQPPRGTVADRISSGAHVGSESVRAFIEARHPRVCFCGHIHESDGVGELAGCTVINAGPAGHGRFSRVVVEPAEDGLVVGCETCTV
jgi:hypothetical protein